MSDTSYIMIWKDSTTSSGYDTYRDDYGRAIAVTHNPEWLDIDRIVQDQEGFIDWLIQGDPETTFVDVRLVREWLGWEVAPVDAQ